MWKENEIFRGDMESLCSSDYLPWKELEGKTVFITGGTGLIGYTITSTLLYRAYKRKTKLRVLLLVRDEAKARTQYAAQLADGCDLGFVTGSVEALPPEARAAVEPLVEIFGDDMKIMPAEEMEDGIHRQEPPPADM